MAITLQLGPWAVAPPMISHVGIWLFDTIGFAPTIGVYILQTLYLSATRNARAWQVALEPLTAHKKDRDAE